MHLFSTTALRPRIHVMLALLLAASTGCQSSTRADRVDPNLARSTLESVLESWKQGDSINSWQQNDADPVVQDLDWSAGYKLLSYEILDQGDSLDANLFCDVKLILEDANSNRLERDVTYVVGTSPVRTVFRSLTP